MKERRNFLLTVVFFSLFWLFIVFSTEGKADLPAFIYILLGWTTAFSLFAMFPFQQYLNEHRYTAFTLAARSTLLIFIGFFWIIILSTKHPLSAVIAAALLMFLLGLNIADIVLPTRTRKEKFLEYEVRRYITGSGGGIQHIIRTNHKAHVLVYLSPELDQKIKSIRKGYVNGSWKSFVTTPIFHRLVDIV